MPNYRRPQVAGASWFVTLVTCQRRPWLRSASAIDNWRDALRQSRRERPFTIDAAVVLPDHCHMVITLPEGDHDISSRIGRAKALFSKLRRAPKSTTSISRHRHRETDTWQRRFFDHVIRNETEYENYVDYIHFNPVKHGLVERPVDWAASSIHEFIRRGICSPDWGAPDAGHAIDTSGIESTVGE